MAVHSEMHCLRIAFADVLPEISPRPLYRWRKSSTLFHGKMDQYSGFGLRRINGHILFSKTTGLLNTLYTPSPPSPRPNNAVQN
jgi:hypothetical protein